MSQHPIATALWLLLIACIVTAMVKSCQKEGMQQSQMRRDDAQRGAMQRCDQPKHLITAHPGAKNNFKNPACKKEEV